MSGEVQPDPSTVSSFHLVKHFKDHENTVNSIDISSDGSLVASSSNDESVHVYNVNSGTVQNKVNSKKYGVDLVTFAQSNDKVVCASNNQWDHSIRHLSLTANSYLRYFSGHRDHVTSISVSNSNESFISGSKDETVRLWDFRSPSSQGRIRRFRTCVSAYDPQGIIFAVASGINTVALYDIKQYSNGPFFQFQVDSERLEWSSIEFSPNGKYLLLLGSGSAFLVDSFNGELIQEFRSNGELMSVAFSPDSQYILCGSQDGSVEVWSCTNAAILSVFSTLPQGVRAVRWNPTRMMVATGSDQVSFWTPRVQS